MLPDLQCWHPNHWLNLLLTDVDLPIGTKRTPRQDAKSDVAQDDEQHNAALRQQNHKKHKQKNLIYVKTTYLDWKKRCRGVTIGQIMT